MIVQKAVGDEDPTVYRNHGAYVRRVTRIVNSARDANFTRKCTSCIVSQFARSIAVANQTSCGPEQPTEPCNTKDVPSEDIEAAVIRSMAVVPDPWGDIGDFEFLLRLTELRLGCVLRDKTTSVNQFLPQRAQSCAVPSVNYCGPGNSQINPLLDLIDVPECLNNSCCVHDSCYKDQCVGDECLWTTQSRQCDDSLVKACNGAASCGLSDLLDPQAIFVCTVVRCLNGSFPGICSQQRTVRLLSNPQCSRAPDKPCYDFSLDWISVDGNVFGRGNPDGVPDFFDDFSDGSVVLPPTSALTLWPDTVVNESGGFLRLGSADGAASVDGQELFGANLLVDTLTLGPPLEDGAGSSVITMSFRADRPSQEQFYGMFLAAEPQPVPSRTVESPSIFATTTGPIVVESIVLAFDWLSNRGVGFGHVDFDSAGRIILRFELNDATNQVAASFSDDEGVTFRELSIVSGQPALSAFNTGTHAFITIFAAVRSPSP